MRAGCPRALANPASVSVFIQYFFISVCLIFCSQSYEQYFKPPNLLSYFCEYSDEEFCKMLSKAKDRKSLSMLQRLINKLK